MARKEQQYQIYWRFADDHDPNGWLSVGKPTKDLTVLKEIVGQEDNKSGQWEEESQIKPAMISYKIMQRTVSYSDFRNLDTS